MVSRYRREALLLLVAGLLAVPGCYLRPPPPTPTTTTTTTPAGPGFVHRSGRDMVDGTGQPLQLRGVNIGQWLMWEQWIMGAPFSGTNETELQANLRTLVGADRAARFIESSRDTFITRSDLEEIAALGFNVVRVPINHTLLEDDGAPGVYRPAGWKRLDDLMTWAEQTKVYVVLDLHGAPCGQNFLFISDPGPVSLWDDAACQNATVALWKAIAARYADRRIVAGWDLLNEPSPRRTADLPALYRRILATLRTVDRNHLVFIEGGDFATDFSMFTGALDPNSAYSFHQYLWGTRDPVGDTTATKAIAARHDLPLWMGEFGQDTLANVARQVDRWNGDPAIGGWAVWTWKGAPGIGGAPALRGVDLGAEWTKVVTWLANPSRPRPTAAEAETGMQRYVEQVKLANTSAEESLISTLGTAAAVTR
jgi:endoglucanase